MTLVVMAAGMGSRYGGLKQLDPVGPCGEFIVDYAVYDAMNAGFDKVVFIIKEENLSVFKETVGNRISRYIQVEYAFQKLNDIPSGYTIPKERTKPWGTGHAVLTAKRLINGSFAVINADDFYGKESYRLINDYLSSPKEKDKAHYCMAGFVLKNTLTENGHVARGVCDIDNNGMLMDVTERTKIKRIDEQVCFFEEADGWTPIDENTVVSMNCWGFDHSFFGFLEKGFCAFLEKNKEDLTKCEYYLPSAVKESMENGKSDVKVLQTAARWYGVTYREDKSAVVSYIKQQIQKGVYPSSLWI